MENTTNKQYKQARCPHCGKGLNFATKKTVDYDFEFEKADNRVFCSKCRNFCFFSIKKD